MLSSAFLILYQFKPIPLRGIRILFPVDFARKHRIRPGVKSVIPIKRLINYERLSRFGMLRQQNHLI